jgi:hypothetical protein
MILLVKSSKVMRDLVLWMTHKYYSAIKLISIENN